MRYIALIPQSAFGATFVKLTPIYLPGVSRRHEKYCRSAHLSSAAEVHLVPCVFTLETCKEFACTTNSVQTTHIIFEWVILKSEPSAHSWFVYFVLWHGVKCVPMVYLQIIISVPPGANFLFRQRSKFTLQMASLLWYTTLFTFIVRCTTYDSELIHFLDSSTTMRSSAPTSVLCLALWAWVDLNQHAYETITGDSSARWLGDYPAFIYSHCWVSLQWHHVKRDGVSWNYLDISHRPIN